MGRAARDLRSDAALFVYGRHWHPILPRRPRGRRLVVELRRAISDHHWWTLIHKCEVFR